MDVYQTDDNREPDSSFEAGTLAHLVVGNAGRLLDQRRTPITLVGIDLQTGMFELEIQAFEDRGAHWRLPFEDVGNFQFAKGAERVAPAPFQTVAEQFDRRLRVEPKPAARARSETRIRELVSEMSDRLADAPRPRDLGGVRTGDSALYSLLERVMKDRGLDTVESAFVATFVSNPRSGEIVKGHAIVAAELGLCRYDGKVIRSASLFDGLWSKERRAEHLLVRLAFMRALFRPLGETVVLYRGISSERQLVMPAASSFVSATFAKEVAEAHFRGTSATVVAALFRQRVSVERLLMTYLETRAMNDRFHEAEAVLLGGAGSHAF